MITKIFAIEISVLNDLDPMGFTNNFLSGQFVQKIQAAKALHCLAWRKGWRVKGLVYREKKGFCVLVSEEAKYHAGILKASRPTLT